jgi:hypothetical protein
VASGPAEYEFSPPPPGPEATVRRWDRNDSVIGLALVVLAISVFLPWFTVTAHIFSPAQTVSDTWNGPRAHGYLWGAFALALIGLVVLMARDAIGRIPGNLPSARQLLVGTSGLALALTVLAIATKPASYATNAPVFQQYFHLTVVIGWSYGGFVAVVAAAAALVTAFTSDRPAAGS